nr:MAG TPA: hypothetical protein [Caudoviricetes sp.]
MFLKGIYHLKIVSQCRMNLEQNRIIFLHYLLSSHYNNIFV